MATIARHHPTRDILTPIVYRVTSIRDSISRTDILFIGHKVEDRRDLCRAVREHLAEGAVFPKYCTTLPLVPHV